MLERKDYSSTSKLQNPNQISIEVVGQLVSEAKKTNYQLNIAEIGVGVGATSQEICKILEGHGKLHIFDFEDVVNDLSASLGEEGFSCVVPHGNSRMTWDSYHWPLLKILAKTRGPAFNYIYLDGSHAAIHELAAFAVIDRLLLPGAFLEFDDYDWSYAGAKNMPAPEGSMTQEQIESQQVKMMVDLVIKPNQAYKEVMPNRLFQKVA